MAGETPENGRCIRAREWSSLAVDGELSELESQLLERHLGICPSCRSFDARLRTATAALRAIPAERPLSSVRLPERRVVAFPARRRRALIGVAAVVAAATLGSLVGSSLQRPVSPARPPAAPQVSLLSRDLDQLRQLPRSPHITPSPSRSVPGGPSEHLI